MMEVGVKYSELEEDVARDPTTISKIANPNIYELFDQVEQVLDPKQSDWLKFGIVCSTFNFGISLIVHKKKIHIFLLKVLKIRTKT